MSGRVFISYSHRDEEFVFKLATDLEERGAEVWIDRGDIRAGAEWRQTIANAVRNCQAFILVISPDAVQSEYVARELSMAEASHKPIFPLIYRKTRLPQMMAGQLEGFQYLSFGRGGYEHNLADLVAGLISAGVPLHDAPEASPEQLAARRRQHLGAPVKTRWGAGLGRIPGWALAWGLGWAIYWLVLPILMMILGGSEVKNFILLPIGGFIGGLVGGLLAAIFTMAALRHNASTIAWKHMSASIRIWGIVGPIGTIIAGSIAFVLVNFEDFYQDVDCAELGFGDCMGAMFGAAIGSAIAGLVILVFLVILYVLIALFLIGVVAGLLAVRHIRRLEPGILGRQAIWVVLGWGVGADLAALASLVIFSLFEAV
ncbi:MAG: toll/interleukin-1 receptor domain-containing protein [Chloroflexota bacterium]